MRKELQQIFRDKQLMFLLFFMPILQIFIYGFALSPEVEHLRLGVIDQSSGVISRDLTADLLVNGVFDLLPSGGTEATLSRRVQDGKLDAGVIMPPDMERLIKANRTAHVQVLLDGVDANTAGIANGYINQIINSANRQLAASLIAVGKYQCR